MRRDRVRVSNLAFADDLLLFCNDDSVSTKVLKEALDLFSSLSSLTANASKSSVFLAGVDSNEAYSIIDCFGFQLEIFLFCYLGVPLVTTKLSCLDCSSLIEKVDNRIKGWENKVSTFAGGLQLGENRFSWFCIELLLICIEQPCVGSCVAKIGSA